MSILTTLRSKTLTFSIGLILSCGSSVHAKELKATDTHEFMLSNGMKVIVKEDHRAPTVAHMVWYKAGSIDEVNGKTGVAHVLEHMMFKGTKKLKPGDFSKQVAAVGGRDNAFTSKDYTAYFQQIEKSHLEKMMALESDRMANLQIREDEFAKEIQVVMEERRLRTDDQASAIVYEQLVAAAFINSPYRNPIIGWMDDLKNMTYHDALEWYQDWYAPNNAVLVVSGDVDPNEVHALAQKYYGAIPAKKIKDRKPQQEIPQIGARRIQVKAPAENPDITFAWKVPKVEPADIKLIDPYALSVLAGILDGHANSRLNRKLVRDLRLADSVDASYGMTGRGPQLFGISASPAKGKTIADIEKHVRLILNEIRQSGVTDAELNRVKSQLLSAQIYKRDSIFAQAMEIGMSEMNGISWKYLDEILFNIQAVTSSDIQKVVEKYFVDDALTVAILEPQPIKEKNAVAQKMPAGMRH
jgi:zinc protease